MHLLKLVQIYNEYYPYMWLLVCKMNLHLTFLLDMKTALNSILHFEFFPLWDWMHSPQYYWLCYLMQPENPAELGGKIYEMMGRALHGKQSMPGNVQQPASAIPQTLEAELVEPVEAGNQKWGAQRFLFFFFWGGGVFYIILFLYNLSNGFWCFIKCLEMLVVLDNRCSKT